MDLELYIEVKIQVEVIRGVNGRAEGDFYLIEVMPNTPGRLKVTLLNSEALNESGELKIYKVPEAPKWLK